MSIVVKPIFLLPLLVIVLAAAPAVAQSTNPPGVGFAMIGIGIGQTARVNALNLATQDLTNSSSCSAILQFLDTQGNVLKQATVNLPPGTAASLDLKKSELPTTAFRIEIRAVALFGYVGGANPPQPILQTAACNLMVPSLEIFDTATGRTRLILATYTQLQQPASQPQ
jgi:hypothetical protein